jgi:lipoate-protein ligase B
MLRNSTTTIGRVAWLGTDVDYDDAWALQRRLVAERAEGRIADTLLLLEHAPVYTAGRRTIPEHVKGHLARAFD